MPCLHLDRTAGGDWNHWHLVGAAVACVEPGKKGCPRRQMQKQSAADRHRAATLRGSICRLSEWRMGKPLHVQWRRAPSFPLSIHASCIWWMVERYVGRPRRLDKL